MTNEELATAIQKGRSDLIARLWDQTEAFIRFRARSAMSNIPASCGVTEEDLSQCGYFALISAIETYDAEKGNFLSWLEFYLKSEFAKAGTYRTSHRDPLNEARSLDAPMTGEDSDGDSAFVDFLPSERDDYAGTDERIFQEQLHTALEEAMDKLPSTQSTVLRERYWSGTRLQTLAENHGVSVEEVRRRERRGLQNLRRSSHARKLAEFLDENTNYFSGTGAQSYQRSGTSSVEYAVLRREELRKMWNRSEDRREPEQ